MNEFSAGRKLSVHSIVSVSFTVALVMMHVLHAMMLPLLAGTMSMEGHSHNLRGEVASTPLWFQLVFLTLNLSGMAFSGRTLWLSQRQKRKNWHSRICVAIAVVTLIVGIFSLLMF
jgi:hypothetical protein